MIMQSVVPGFNVGDSARLFEEIDKDPEVVKEEQKVATLRKECDRVDLTLRLKGDKLQSMYPQLCSDYWKELREQHIKICKTVSWLPIYGAGTTIMVGMFTGLISQSHLGLIAGLSLLSTFVVIPRLYANVAQKFIMPRQMDKHIHKLVEGERDSLQDKLKSAESQLEKTKSRALSRLAELLPAEESKGVEDESEFVVIDGVKLDKKMNYIRPELCSAAGEKN